MVAPDVEIDDGKGTILISSEDADDDDVDATYKEKVLADFAIRDGTRLKGVCQLFRKILRKLGNDQGRRC